MTEAARAAAGARGQLSRERIVRAAIAVIERDGDDEVSMRRLAAELGCGVMSLYNHVPNKDALLDAVAEFVMADLRVAPDAAGDWREQARIQVRSFREIARRYPRCVDVVVARHLNSPAGLHPLESALATARRAGFDGAAAVRIVRAFVAYALGSIANEARLRRLAPDPLARAGGHFDAAEFPHIAELADELVRFDPEADFAFGLELLIGAVAALPR
jgi:AcrR family transcriptional regulator